MPDTPAVATDDKRLERIEGLLTDGQKKASEDATAAAKWRADADVRFTRLEKASATQTISVANPKIEFAPIIRGLLTGKWDGFERVRDEGLEALKTRDMSVTSATGGGHITPIVYVPQLIEMLFPQSALTRAGVRQISGLRGQSRKLPRHTSGPVFSYFEENPAGGVPATALAFDQVEVTPHTAGAKIVMSRLLAENADPAVEQIVRTMLARYGSLFQDFIGLYGSGTGQEPAGLLEQGVPTDSLGGVITLDETRKMVTAVKSANGIGNPATTGFVMHPRDWGKLCLEKASTAGTYQLSPDPKVGVQETLHGYPVHLTTQITGSEGTEGDTCVFFGDWSQLWHCTWSDFVIEESREGTYFDKHQVAIKLVFNDDWLVAQPDSFAVLTNVLDPDA